MTATEKNMFTNPYLCLCVSSKQNPMHLNSHLDVSTQKRVLAQQKTDIQKCNCPVFTEKMCLCQFVLVCMQRKTTSSGSGMILYIAPIIKKSGRCCSQSQYFRTASPF